MTAKKKDAWEGETIEEVMELLKGTQNNKTPLEIIKTALKAKETQRISHKRYQLKKQAELDAARELKKRRPELFKDIEEKYKTTI